MPAEPPFHERFRIATEKLQAGCNPEEFNETPAKPDVWLRALGWQDAILEELLERRSATEE